MPVPAQAMIIGVAGSAGGWKAACDGRTATASRSPALQPGKIGRRGAAVAALPRQGRRIQHRKGQAGLDSSASGDDEIEYCRARSGRQHREERGKAELARREALQQVEHADALVQDFAS